MALRIVTDSSCDLPASVVQRLGIAVVPCNVHFGSESLRDGVDIQPAQFYARLAGGGVHPTTSQPSVGQFAEVFQRLVGEGHDVLAIVLSSKLSGTYNGALQARQETGAASRIAVVDSLQVSLALGLLVQEAARMAQGGAGLDAVAAMVQRETASVRCYFSVDTLRYLVRGGRASHLQGFFGALLDIKPVLVLRDGEIHPLDRVRSRRRVLERLREIAAAYQEVRALGVVHSASPEDAEALARHCRDLFPNVESLVSEFTPVLGVHVGPGALGLAIWGHGPGTP